jgi:hypothetical protein
LIYLTTLFAIGFALLRPIFSQNQGWLFNTVAAAYIGLLVIYCAFRLPILRRRLRNNAKRLHEKRQELSQAATGLRQSKNMQHAEDE